MTHTDIHKRAADIRKELLHPTCSHWSEEAKAQAHGNADLFDALANVVEAAMLYECLDKRIDMSKALAKLEAIK